MLARKNAIARHEHESPWTTKLYDRTPGRPKCVAANPDPRAEIGGAALDHAPGIDANFSVRFEPSLSVGAKGGVPACGSGFAHCRPAESVS